MREKCGPLSHCCKHCRTKGDLTQREKCGGNSLRWSKVCSIEAELEFRINCSTLAFLSLRKKTATLVSKNHTRKKCDSVNNIIRAVVLLLLCYMHRREEDKDSIVRDNVLLVCVFELLTSFFS